MKKIKKIAALLLCLCMLVASAAMAVPAAAQEDYEKDETWLLQAELSELYYRGEYKFDHDLPPSRYPVYTAETLTVMLEKMEEAEEYVKYDPDNLSNLTIANLTAAYKNLEAAYDGLRVRTDVLQELFDVAKNETNDAYYYSRRYYPEEMWKSYCGALKQAEKVLAAPDDDAVTGAYFNLRSQFNVLCKSNQMAGDVDNNGRVNVSDVLYLQKYLAKLVPMNSSQKFVAAVSAFTLETVNADDVIIMQKYLAGSKEELLGFDLADINQRDYNSLIDKGKII